MSLLRVLAVLVGAICLATASVASPPNIVLITIDTTRADRMGFLGSKRGLTPNLDMLADESAVFTRAYSQAPLTVPSHSTILTGTYPQFHQVNDFQVPLIKELPYAPEILRQHGYRTGAFVGAIVLDPAAGLARGLERGFDTYDAGFHQRGPGDDRYSSTERRGGEVVAHALAWLSEHPQGPFFIWVHLYDAHDPYDPPEPFKTKYSSAPYDGEIAYMDSAIGSFLAELRARGLYDGALIAVMADHGEALGDHGEDTHGFFLYDETIHVPLLIKPPGIRKAGTQPARRSAGQTIDSRVGLVDVMPTILQAAGVTVPREVQGESLTMMMKAWLADEPGQDPAPDTVPDRPSYAETDYPQRMFGWSALRALRTGKYLYIQAPRQELYDQSVDPKAERDLSASSSAVTTTLASQLASFRAKTASSREASKSAFDPEAQAKLAALGYAMSSNIAAKPVAKIAGADPKDKIEIGNLLHRAYLLVDDQRYQDAIPLLREVIAKDPDTPLAYAQLGQSLVSLQQYREAIPVLRRAVKLNPELTLSHFQLGQALIESGDTTEATTELETVATRVPQWKEAHLLLQVAYAQTGRLSKAITECKKVLELDPDHYGSNLLLGRLLVLKGSYAAAVPNLKKAAALDPKAPEPHLFLAEAYVQSKRKADAARELAEAKRLGARDQQ
jgi:arylsulfatase A-like enzyme/Tfp pilus assembly protein PilF